MKVGFGCDHASVGLKHILMEHVRNKGYECVDYGTTDPKVPVDYPEFGLKVAEAIKSKEVEKGIEVKSDAQLAGGFRIGVKDGSAYYDFSAEAVADLFSAYISSRAASLLKDAVKEL